MSSIGVPIGNRWNYLIDWFSSIIDGIDNRWRSIITKTCAINILSTLLFIHTFKNTTQPFKTFFCKRIAHKCYISSFKSKHVFIAVSDFGDRKKKSHATWHFQFPPHPGKGQIPLPGKALSVKFPTSRRGTENSQMPGVCPDGGRGIMLKFWFDRRINKCLVSRSISLSFTLFFIEFFFSSPSSASLGAFFA